MDKLEKKKLKKKMEFHKALGAEKFQKVVFGVEKAKFKVLKTICPNFPKYFDKYCDFKKKRAINKATSEEQINSIITKISFDKMAMRKEFNQEKNRNYHIDNRKPTEIIKYLNWNKDIHKKGLIKDTIVIPFLVAGSITQIPGALPLLIIELISAGINFECINIQDYNICRYKIAEETLKKKEEKRLEKNIEEYSEAASVIHKTFTKKADVPTIDEIVDNIENKKQLEQLKKLVYEAQKERKECGSYKDNKPRQMVR